MIKTAKKREEKQHPKGERKKSSYHPTLTGSRMHSIYHVARHLAYKNTLAYLTPRIFCTYVYRGIRVKNGLARINNENLEEYLCASVPL